MACEYCRREENHNCRCPNYIPPKTHYYCSICSDGIYDGEEYIENDDRKYAHWECFSGTRDLVEWLDFEIKTMDGDYN